MLTTFIENEEGQSIEDLVVVKMWGDDDDLLRPEDLAMAIRTLLRATERKREGTKRRRVRTIHEILELPEEYEHRRTAFEAKIENLSTLLYRINRAALQKFLAEQENVYLLRFFKDNGGLAATDPHNKPACRESALHSLISAADDSDI